jgi:RNA polymerase sigma factor (sigma-70 family)
MTPTSMGPLLRHLRKITDPSNPPTVNDAELLKRFIDQRDQVAFELLVWRHQRMVLGVCRRVLGNAHDAEDAFQAAFLALVRKAASVSRRDAVAAWLHTVAYRIALRARGTASKRARTDIDLDTIEALPNSAEDAMRSDLASVLDEEVSRLPAKYRIAVMLCYLEGKTYREAGRQLGVPVGTLSARLTRARTLLRTRLMRRGIDISAALLGTLLCEQAASAAAPAALVNTTIQSATSMAAGQSASAASSTVAALIEGALQNMVLNKVKIVTAGLLATFLVAGAGLLLPTAMLVRPAATSAPPAKVAEVIEKAARVDRQGDPLPAGALFRFGSRRPSVYMGRIHSTYSPDGHFIAVGDARGRLDLWDTRTGRTLRTLRRDGKAVLKLAFTPDGKLLAEARADNAIHFWAVPSGDGQRALRFDVEQRLFQMGTLAFANWDGRRLIIINGSQVPSLREVSTGKDRLPSDDVPFEWKGFVRGGKVLLVADPFLVFLDTADGQTQKGMVRLQGRAPDDLDYVAALALSPDGQRLALGLHTGDVCLCDVQTGGEATRFRAVDHPKGPVDPNRNFAHGIFGQGVVWGLSFSPDGKWLSTSGTDGSVRLWEIVTRREVLRFTGHHGYAHEVAFGADSRTILSCGEDAQAYLWTLRPLADKDAKPSLDSLWSALASEPSKAYRAIWAMSETKDASMFLRGKITLAKPIAKERLAKLIADLDSDQFAVRESATKTLAKLGEMAVPALREALRDKPSPEARKRLEELVRMKHVEKMTLSAEELRMWRAIDVLERLGTTEARQVLKTLADGAPEALSTTAARTALKRLGP